MKLLQKLGGFVPREWRPEPKILAAGATAGAASLVTMLLGKKGYKIPKAKVNDVVTGVVGLTGALVTAAGYMKSNKAKLEVGVTS